MGLQDVVLGRVAVLVEDDAVDGLSARRLPQEDGVATWSASISRRSSFTGESTCGLATSIAKTSPDSARGHPHGAEFLGQRNGIGPPDELLLHQPVGRSSSVSICSRGPVPMVSLASVETIPRA